MSPKITRAQLSSSIDYERDNPTPGFSFGVIVGMVLASILFFLMVGLR